jgi:hypothetical protein
MGSRVFNKGFELDNRKSKPEQSEFGYNKHCAIGDQSD